MSLLPRSNSLLFTYLAAEESLMMALILPWLKVKPTWFALSFCIVMVRSNGLSLTASEMRSPLAFLMTLEALSLV